MANSRGHRDGRWNSPKVRDDMIHRYVEGNASLRQIAAALDCSYGTVHLVLTAAGVSLRPRGGSPRRAAERVTRGPEPRAESTDVAVPGTPTSHRPRSRS